MILNTIYEKQEEEESNLQIIYKTWN